jgi:hypothetical protein
MRENKMELIDAYVTEVGRHLPEKQRADIEREIRSMIEDTLEDESRSQGRPADEDMLVDVLKRLGSPERLAASYAPPRYLVGPALYPSYLLSLRLVLGIVLAIGAIGVAISATLGAGFGANANAPLEALRALGQGAMGLLSAGIQVVGMVTIIFALIQRSAPGLKPAAIPFEFDPRKLKVAPEPEVAPFKPAGLVVDIVMSLIALALFNFFPQVVGVYSYNGSQWNFAPVLTAAFFAYVPLMSVLWSLEVALKGSVLAAGRWTEATRWLRIGLKVLTIGLIYLLLTGPDIVSVPVEAIMNPGSAAFPGQFSYWINVGVRLSLGIALVVSIIEVIVTTVKQLLGKKPLLAIV